MSGLTHFFEQSPERRYGFGAHDPERETELIVDSMVSRGHPVKIDSSVMGTQVVSFGGEGILIGAWR